MWRAIVEGREQAAIHTEFTEAVEEENRALLGGWVQRVKQFELNPAKKKNPYSVAGGKQKSELGIAVCERAWANDIAEDTIKQIRLDAAKAQGHAAAKIGMAGPGDSHTHGVGSEAGGEAGAKKGKRKRDTAPDESLASGSAINSPVTQAPQPPAGVDVVMEDAASISPVGESCAHAHEGESAVGTDPEEEAARAQFLLLGIKIQNDRCATR